MHNQGEAGRKDIGGVAIPPKKNYISPVSDYQCPKCGGTEYFMSQKIVMTGIGGIWGNRGGVKQFATCRVCNEIMSSTRKRNKPLKIILIIIGI